MNTRTGGSARFAAWFVLAIVISLLAHMVFFEHSRGWKIASFSAESYDTIVPRTFRMNRVEIDPATLEEKPKQTVQPRNEPKQIDLPPEKPSTENQRVEKKQPLMKDPTVGSDHPVAEAVSGESSGPRIDVSTISQLMEGNPKAPRLPLDPLKDLAEEGGGKGSTPSAPAFSSLDALLEGNEKLTSATAPILMPTDLLFGYDSSTLRPEAAKSMEKLGTLIMKNGTARFRIEGHTDSFGSEEYNNALSLRRAEEVKAWLVRTMRIDPARITTAGLGKSHLLSAPSGTIEQQQLNRRVEIVITQAPGAIP